MNILLLLTLATSLSCIKASTSYQYVRFLNSKPIKTVPAHKNIRPSFQPSFHFPNNFLDDEVWPESFFSHSGFLDVNLPHFHRLHDTHVSPDYSNGLQYPDPYLLTGSAAKRAAAYLYGKELFFTDIPHVRQLLKLQEQRVENGLQQNTLGSLRPTSPFYRDNQFHRFYSNFK